MTVEKLDFDEELNGHAAVILDAEIEQILHARVTAYPDGQPEQQTECGKPIEGGVDKPRESFDWSEVEHCSGCWPDDIPTSPD